MLYHLNATTDTSFWDNVKANLPLIIILGAVLLAIIVLVLVMIIRTVQNKKRTRREMEEAAFKLANGPLDEEYMPDLPEEEPEEPAPAEEEKPVEVQPAEEVQLEAEVQPAEEIQPEAELFAEETKPEEEAETSDGTEASSAEEKKEEPEMQEKKHAGPAKKQEPAKKDNKPVKKAEPKPAAKKEEPQKVSAANGKWIIEEVKGEFWLTLIAPNGQVMLESPTAYASLQGARSGIKTYQDNIAAGRLKITEHKNGDSQVQVLNGRNSLLATSSTYSSRTQAESALASIKRWASTTAVEEVAEKKE